MFFIAYKAGMLTLGAPELSSGVKCPACPFEKSAERKRTRALSLSKPADEEGLPRKLDITLRHNLYFFLHFFNVRRVIYNNIKQPIAKTKNKPEIELTMNLL